MTTKLILTGAAFSLLVALLFFSCKKEPEVIPNQPPLAIGGADRMIALPQDSVHLDGSASKDSDGTIVSFKWDKIGGPQQFMITSTTTAKTAVTGLVEGMYQFQLTTTDNSGASARDTVQVTVNKPATGNQAPVARAGGDQQVIQSINAFTLDGGASSDPDGTITAWRWTKIAGPATASLATPTAAHTLVTGATTGVYQFELQVTDNGGQSAKDTLQVTVLETAPCNDEGARVVSGPGELTAFGSLSLRRSSVMSVAVADKLVFAGGWDDTYNYTPSDRVDIYNLTTKTWSTAQLSKADIYQHVTVGNKILFVSYQGSIDVYDAVANSWSVLSATPVAGRYLPGIAVLGSKVFFAGGFVNGGPTSEVNIYDAAANTWSKAQLSEGRAGITTAVLGNKLLFAGGFQGMDWDDNPQIPSKKVDIYDGATNTWSTADLPQPQYFGSAAVAGNKAVFAFESMNNVTIYDATTNKFSAVSLSQPRAGARVVSVGNKILVAGGYDAGGQYSSRVDIYDASTGSWLVANMSRSGNVAWSAVLGNKLLLAVYNNDGNVNGSVFDVYDAGSNTFTAVQLSHQFFATPVAADGKLYFGGALVGAIGNPYVYSSCNVWQFEFK